MNEKKIKDNFLNKEKYLSCYATKSSDAIRLKEEKEDIRPPYFHYIDRIIHALSYSRYMDKTQVFSECENDHISRRMVHVQLVSKTARTIGRALNLNDDLIEAIALSHDIGHTPLGHSGEAMLNEISMKELNEAFQDEAHIIYVNSRKQNDTELGKLMHDLHCKKADEMHSPILAKRVYELKETQKGVELMCHEMEKIYSEGMESGEKRGIEMGELKAKKETILSLAEMGIPVDKIAKAVNLSEKDVQKWIDENLCTMK